MSRGVAGLLIVLLSCVSLAAAYDYTFNATAGGQLNWNDQSNWVSTNPQFLAGLIGGAPITGTLGTLSSDRIIIDPPVATTISYTLTGSFVPYNVWLGANAVLYVQSSAQFRVNALLNLADGAAVSCASLGTNGATAGLYLVAGTVNVTSGTTSYISGCAIAGGGTVAIVAQQATQVSLDGCLLYGDTILTSRLGAMFTLGGDTVPTTTSNGEIQLRGAGTFEILGAGLSNISPTGGGTDWILFYSNTFLRSGSRLTRKYDSGGGLQVLGGSTFTCEGGDATTGAQTILDTVSISLGSSNTADPGYLVFTSGTTAFNRTHGATTSSYSIISMGNAFSTWTVSASGILSWENEYTSISNNGASSNGAGYVYGMIKTITSLRFNGLVNFYSGSVLEVRRGTTEVNFNGNYPGSSATFISATIRCYTDGVNGPYITSGSYRSLQFNGTSYIDGGYFKNQVVFNGQTYATGDVQFYTSGTAGSNFISNGGYLTFADANVMAVNYMRVGSGAIIETSGTQDIYAESSSSTAYLSVMGGQVKSSGTGKYSLGYFGSGYGSVQMEAGYISTIGGATFDVAASSSVNALVGSETVISGSTWVNGMGTFKVDGQVTVNTDLFLNALDTRVTTGYLVASSSGRIWVAGNASLSLNGGQLDTSLDMTNGGGYVEVASGGRINIVANNGWIGGNYRFAEGAKLVVSPTSTTYTLNVANDTYFMPSKLAGAGGVTINAAATLETYTTYSTSMASGDLETQGITVWISGNLRARKGRHIFLTEYINSTGNYTMGTTAYIMTGGNIDTDANSFIYVGWPTDTAVSVLSASGTTTGVTTTPTFDGGTVTVYGVSQFVIPSGGSLSITDTSIINGTGEFLVQGALAITGAPLTLAAPTTVTGTISLTSSSYSQIKVTGDTVVNGNITSSGSSMISASNGGTLTLGGAFNGAILFSTSTTQLSVDTSSTLQTELFGWVEFASSTTISGGGDFSADGDVYVDAGKTITASGVGRTTISGLLEMDVGSDWNGGPITFESGAVLSMKAHATNGFTALDFTGSCVAGGTFKVDLNGYVPSTKVRVATFGSAISGHFATDINGNAEEFPWSRRLMASSKPGNIVFEGTIAYYDPTAAANSATSSGPSMVVAAIAAIVAMVFARRW